MIIKFFKFQLHLSHLGQRFYIAGLIILALFGHASSFAVDLRFIDQHGAPVENVVITYGQTSSDTDTLAIMDQIDKQFLPHVLVIEKGQQVAFPNSDEIRHHIYSFSKTKPFEFRLFKGGERKSLVFDDAGIVVLGCNIHDQMVGYIYVKDHQNYALTDTDGKASIDTTAANITLWHSRLSVSQTERLTVAIDPSLAHTQVIDIQLLPKKNTQIHSTFGSGKFKRGSN